VVGAEVERQRLCVQLAHFRRDTWLTVWQWEWHNNYSPGPEVYDELWHIRREPATVTPFLPTECPVPNAQSRILGRRQTEGDIQRNFYVVEVTHSDACASSFSGIDAAETSSTELLHVDLSRILEFVSPDALERYENEQFRIEAEAEEVAMRAEAEELARRRLEKNARMAAIGQGSHILGSDREARTRGRPRGRGRGRGRGPGSWRARNALVTNAQPYDEDVEPDEALRRVEEDIQLMTAETESDKDDFETPRGPTSPSIARSAFVANSALPVSPVLSHRRPTIIANTQYYDDESKLDLANGDDGSISSAAMQLRIEDDVRGRTDESSDDASSHNGHRSKRRRTESTTPRQRQPPARTTATEQHLVDRDTSLASSIPESPLGSAGSYSDGELMTMEYTRVRNPIPSSSKEQRIEAFLGQTRVPYAIRKEEDTMGDGSDAEDDSEVEDNGEVKNDAEAQDNGGVEDNGEDTEEYVVEAIIDHFHNEAGKKWYLVKWQGYEDSEDWLADDELEGAAELVAEYNAKMCKGKRSRQP
jgi:hypothetical protein